MPYQEAPSPPMTPALRHACETSIHVVKSDGSVLKAGRAVLFILDRIGVTPLLRILTYPPFIWFVDIGYYIIAKNRPFFANFLFTKELPPPPGNANDGNTPAIRAIEENGDKQ